VEAARHDGGNELCGHALHHFVGGGDGGHELPARGRGQFGGDQRGRDDGDGGVGEHAERVPLAAREYHLRVDEGRAGLGEPGAAAQHGGNARTTLLLFLHQRQGLPACRHGVRDQCGGEGLQDDALRAVDH